LAGYAVFSHFSDEVIAAKTAVAAGAIMAMLVDMMIPEAFESAHNFAGLITVTDFLAAFVLTKLGGYIGQVPTCTSHAPAHGHAGSRSRLGCSSTLRPEHGFEARERFWGGSKRWAEGLHRAIEMSSGGAAISASSARPVRIHCS
jgi:hypothetical protein